MKKLDELDTVDQLLVLAFVVRLLLRAWWREFCTWYAIGKL